MNIKTQRHLSRLIFRYLRDRLNEEESRELERWRAASEAHELLFRRLLSSAHWQRSIGRFVKMNPIPNPNGRSSGKERSVGTEARERSAGIVMPQLSFSLY